MRKIAASRSPASIAPINRGVVAKGASIPAPVEGWDAASPIAAMPPKRAVALDNWFPQPGWVELRKGHVVHCDTGDGEPVESVMAYHGSVQTFIFAASNGKIFDVTSGTAVSAVSGLTNNRWQHVNFTTSGGHYLYCVNGDDDPEVFDGSTWSNPSITGPVTAADFIGVNVYKSRLWFVPKASTKVVYLATDSIAGTATTFELGGVMSLGGHVEAMGTWSVDAGNGPEDYAVFVTSRGQVMVYRGDPATTFSLVGVFNIGSPLGRRCLKRAGADLAIICVDGVVPLSKAMIFERAAIVKVALTDRILNAMNRAALSYGENFGWQLESYARGTRIVLNVPVQENAEQVQFVMNTQHGAWCRFTGMNANCWEVWNDRIFFGGNDGKVYEADVSGTDISSSLMGTIKGAFQFFGERGRQKRWTALRPIYATDSDFSPGLGFNVDFRDDASIYTPQSIVNVGALWDDAEWDVDDWGGSFTTKTDWRSAPGMGFCAAVTMTANIQPMPDASPGPEFELRVFGFDTTYEDGGFI